MLAAGSCHMSHGHGFPPRRGRYHVPDATSRTIVRAIMLEPMAHKAHSSICSAGSLFSVMVSSSSALSHRASDMSSPQTFAIHLENVPS